MKTSFLETKLMRFLCMVAIVALALVFCIPQAHAATVTSGHDKSKTATALDKNYKSQVTLSLPSKQTQLDSDIVFVMDKSSCTPGTLEKAEPLFSNLEKVVKEKDAKVKVAVVSFYSESNEVYPLTEINKNNFDTEYAKIKAAVGKSQTGHGTNMQAGLEKAQAILAGDTTVSNDRKNLILISDGMTRLFSKNGVVEDVYAQYDTKGGASNLDKNSPDYKKYFSYMGDVSVWNAIRNDNKGNYNIPGGDWNKYWNTIVQNAKADRDSSNDPAVSWDTYGNTADTEKILNDQNFKYVAYGDYDNHALSLERAMYEAYLVYANLAKNYNCYSVYAGTDINGTSDKPVGKAFMNQLAASETTQTSSETLSQDTFDNITDHILYFIGSGSKVEDVIGYGSDYNFDVVDPDSMVIKVETNDGVTTYNAKEISKNNYEFVNSKNEKYPATVVYTPGAEGKEKLTWTINTNVTNFERVSLTYTVQLKNPKTEPGTYKVDTNKSATLYPKDSLGNNGSPELFQVPELSYTVNKAAPQNTPTTKTQNDSKPKTGDNTNISIWMTILGLGVVAAGSIIAGRKNFVK